MLRTIYAVIFLFVCSVSVIHPLHAQCFVSPGNPIAGSSNVGVLQKNTWRLATLYKHQRMGDYFDGNQNIGRGIISSANYNFISTGLTYGLSSRISLEAEAGYFINKTWHYTADMDPTRGHGLANAVLSFKYLFHHDPRNDFEFSGSAGLSIPFSSEPLAIDGVQLPVELQPSTGTYGVIFQSVLMKEYPHSGWRFFLINRAELGLNENAQGYRFGDAWHTSFFVSKHLFSPYTDLTKDLTAILQIRHQYMAQNHLAGETIAYSGSHQIFIAPQLNYNLAELWNLSVIVEIPVYQDYKGIQLANKFGAALVVTRDLGHHR
jgi:hypothetical protein